MIICGNVAGSLSPSANWNQLDPSKADYIRGREDLAQQLAGAQKKHKTVTAVLSSSGWKNSSQTVTAEGVSAANTLIVASSPENYEAYSKAGVYCAAQSVGNVTFQCKSLPAADLTANIMILD